MVKKIQYLFVLILVFALTAAFSGSKGKGGGVKVIVIDPGHGGKDPGCNGASSKEKDVSLAVALKLGKLIEENLKDVKVIFTRSTDVFVELEDRAQMANKAKADLFISIHCNAAGKPVIVKDKKTGKKRVKTYKNKRGKIVPVETTNPIPFGTETYVMGLKNEEGKMKVATRENSAMLLEDDYETKYAGFDPESEESYIVMSNYTSAYVIQSANLAVKIQDEYTKKAGRIDKGVHRQSIWVLWRTAMPSILTELGFLTNPLEEQFLASVAGQDYLAKSIFRGLRKYKDDIENAKKEYNDEIENQSPLENENVKAGNNPNQKSSDDDELEDDDVKKSDVKNDAKKDEVKEEEKKDVAVKQSTVEIKEEKRPEQKEEDNKKLENGPGKDKDTVKAKEGKVDTTMSAKDIAEKYKKEHKNIEKQKTETKKEEDLKSKDNEKISGKNLIAFKVQFASSDVELNLKDKKFSDIISGNFYKVKNVMKYTSGNFNSIKDAAAHQNFLRDKGFKDCFVIALKNGERMDINEAKKEAGQ